MKKILLLSLLSLIALSPLSAQRRNKNINIEDIEYKSVVVNYTDATELLMFIPVDLRIVEGEEGRIEISYPVQEEEYIKYGLYDGCKFIIGRNGSKKTPKNSVICDKIPVRMTVSLSSLRRLFTNSEVDITILHDSFNHSLEIANGLSMSINAKSITATESIKVNNFGTLTCKVEKWNTTTFKVLNRDGWTYLRGNTTAKSITYRSNSRDNVDMVVACEELTISSHSRGKGSICFTGTTDQVSLSARRKSTTIITLPKLNN